MVSAETTIMLELSEHEAQVLASLCRSVNWADGHGQVLLEIWEELVGCNVLDDQFEVEVVIDADDEYQITVEDVDATAECEGCEGSGGGGS